MVIPEAAAHWWYLGIQLLKSRMGTLSTIKANYPQDVNRCCQALLEKWLESQSDASWDQLIEALESPLVEMVYLAERIKSRLGNMCCECHYHTSMTPVCRKI